MAELAELQKSRAVSQSPNARLDAIAQLYENSELASFVMQLDPLDLETTKMCLIMLGQLEATCLAERGRTMTHDELSYALEAILKDPNARSSVVQFYQDQRRLTGVSSARRVKSLSNRDA